MANNQNVNKVVINNAAVIDLTADTVDASHLLQGYTAHDASGAAITGTATAGAEVESVDLTTATGMTTHDISATALIHTYDPNGGASFTPPKSPMAYIQATWENVIGTHPCVKNIKLAPTGNPTDAELVTEYGEKPKTLTKGIATYVETTNEHGWANGFIRDPGDAFVTLFKGTDVQTSDAETVTIDTSLKQYGPSVTGLTCNSDGTYTLTLYDGTTRTCNAHAAVTTSDELVAITEVAFSEVIVTDTTSAGAAIEVETSAGTSDPVAVDMSDFADAEVY